MRACGVLSVFAPFVGGFAMTDVKKMVLCVSVGVAAVTALHLAYNFNWADFRNASLPPGQRKLNVAFIPVT